VTRPESAAPPVDLLVLHALRCGGQATPPRLAAATGLADDAVESQLIDLGAAGLVVRAREPFPGWRLTDRGRAADARRIAAELDAAGAGAAVAAALDRFLELNPELLDLCTAWQLRTVDGETVVNDHDDPDHDSRVLDRFADLHRRLAVVCDGLACALPRFAPYPRRLGAALDRARAGDLRQVTDSTASFHTVWAELHEDLLATLGIPR
jgi:hypothetical protein